MNSNQCINTVKELQRRLEEVERENKELQAKLAVSTNTVAVDSDVLAKQALWSKRINEVELLHGALESELLTLMSQQRVAALSNFLRTHAFKHIDDLAQRSSCDALKQICTGDILRLERASENYIQEHVSWNLKIMNVRDKWTKTGKQLQNLLNDCLADCPYLNDYVEKINLQSKNRISEARNNLTDTLCSMMKNEITVSKQCVADAFNIVEKVYLTMKRYGIAPPTLTMEYLEVINKIESAHSISWSDDIKIDPHFKFISTLDLENPIAPLDFSQEQDVKNSTIDVITDSDHLADIENREPCIKKRGGTPIKLQNNEIIIINDSFEALDTQNINSAKKFKINRAGKENLDDFDELNPAELNSTFDLAGKNDVFQKLPVKVLDPENPIAPLDFSQDQDVKNSTFDVITDSDHLADIENREPCIKKRGGAPIKLQNNETIIINDSFEALDTQYINSAKKFKINRAGKESLEDFDELNPADLNSTFVLAGKNDVFQKLPVKVLDLENSIAPLDFSQEQDVKNSTFDVITDSDHLTDIENREPCIKKRGGTPIKLQNNEIIIINDSFEALDTQNINSAKKFKINRAGKENLDDFDELNPAELNSTFDLAGKNDVFQKLPVKVLDPENPTAPLDFSQDQDVKNSTFDVITDSDHLADIENREPCIKKRGGAPIKLQNNETIIINDSFEALDTQNINSAKNFKINRAARIVKPVMPVKRASAAAPKPRSPAVGSSVPRGGSNFRTAGAAAPQPRGPAFGSSVPRGGSNFRTAGAAAPQPRGPAFDSSVPRDGSIFRTGASRKDPVTERSMGFKAVRARVGRKRIPTRAPEPTPGSEKE